MRRDLERHTRVQQELIDALTAWEEKCKTLKNKNSQLTVESQCVQSNPPTSASRSSPQNYEPYFVETADRYIRVIGMELSNKKSRTFLCTNYLLSKIK